jgi:hypothetical protein
MQWVLGISGRVVTLTARSHLVLRLRIGGGMPPQTLTFFCGLVLD